jgi:ATPase subunit of ABC transporter with duplicated ATPase domains
LLTTTELSMNYGGQVLFLGADLQLDAGKRYGIVGANGSGKSTLLRILAGQEIPSAGEVNRPRNCRIGVLEQDHFQYEAVTILDLVMMGNAVLWEAMEGKEALLTAAEADESAFDEERYTALEDVILQFDGYTLESRAGAILEGLGIPVAVHQQPLSSLSGGFKLRVLLAKTLASEPDLLFLDEPTNHLDILAIRWLERFLTTFKGCSVVVSHDLSFLDAVCTHVLDVDYQQVTSYRGNYTAFVKLKAEERIRREAEIEKRKKEIATHKAFIARFQAKATKARQANSRQKRMEKIVLEELPLSSRRHPRFQFKARRPSGRTVLTVKGISKAYGDNAVLNDVSIEVERGDRLAIIGPNGVGKSTLLKICIGQVLADAGEVTWGYEADAGYFPQDHAEALGDPQQSVLSCLWESLPNEGRGAILGRLGAVLFTRDDADKKVENLSGGEGARLLFSRLGALQSTVMVLDEPTNHLDIEGIEALAGALRRYDGTLIFVSHDRWFVQRLATRVLDIRHDGIEDHKGSYHSYLRNAELDRLDAAAVVASAKKEKRDAKKLKKAAASPAPAKTAPKQAQEPASAEAAPTKKRRRKRRRSGKRPGGGQGSKA